MLTILACTVVALPQRSHTTLSCQVVGVFRIIPLEGLRRSRRWALSTTVLKDVSVPFRTNTLYSNSFHGSLETSIPLGEIAASSLCEVASSPLSMFSLCSIFVILFKPHIYHSFISGSRSHRAAEASRAGLQMASWWFGSLVEPGHLAGWSY